MRIYLHSYDLKGMWNSSAPDRVTKLTSDDVARTFKLYFFAGAILTVLYVFLRKRCVEVYFPRKIRHREKEAAGLVKKNEDDAFVDSGNGSYGTLPSTSLPRLLLCSL